MGGVRSRLQRLARITSPTCGRVAWPARTQVSEGGRPCRRGALKPTTHKRCDTYTPRGDVPPGRPRRLPGAPGCSGEREGGTSLRLTSVCTSTLMWLPKVSARLCPVPSSGEGRAKGGRKGRKGQGKGPPKKHNREPRRPSWQRSLQGMWLSPIIIRNHQMKYLYVT